MDESLKAAGIDAHLRENAPLPLFQAFDRKRKLTGRALLRRDALEMVKRRAQAAGLPWSTCNHTFCATGITAYLENGGTIENTAATCAGYGVGDVNRRGSNAYGDAVRTLVAEARGRYILNLDADGSHSPKYFASIWDKRSEFDIIIGSRYAPRRPDRKSADPDLDELHRQPHVPRCLFHPRQGRHEQLPPVPPRDFGTAPSAVR